MSELSELLARKDPATAEIIQLQREQEEILNEQCLWKQQRSFNSEDPLGAALIPDDQNLPHGLRALKVTGDGNVQ